jgi:hypothetical protein
MTAGLPNGSWVFQRQRLVHFRVAAASWIALYRAVGVEPRTSLWRSYVEGIGEFATNRENAWPTLLPKVFYFAALRLPLALSGGAQIGSECERRHIHRD